jgi:hypothetical protein
MPLDETLPPSRLTPRTGSEEIVRHFVAAFGVRVDVDGLEHLPRPVRLRLTGVRLPEPPEAVLLDRVLQALPLVVLGTVERVLIVDNGTMGHLGVYSGGVIRIGTDALLLRQPDREFAGRLSVFAGTVLHEFGHAAYERVLTPAQRSASEDLYLASLEADDNDAAAPTVDEAEHHFVALFVAAAAGLGYGPYRAVSVREALVGLGVSLR